MKYCIKNNDYISNNKKLDVAAKKEASSKVVVGRKLIDGESIGSIVEQYP